MEKVNKNSHGLNKPVSVWSQNENFLVSHKKSLGFQAKQQGFTKSSSDYRGNIFFFFFHVEHPATEHIHDPPLRKKNLLRSSS